MNEISVKLLGIPIVKYNDEEIYFPYKKAAGLFYYMCISKKSSREELMNIFWADYTEHSARKNLRDALYKIKKTFNFDVFISPVKSIVELNPNYVFNIDIDDISKSNIFSIYNGDFLDGFSIKNCYDFENWMLRNRDHFKSLYIKSVTKKLHELISIGDLTRIESLSNIIINNDPYNEKIYRDIMKIYALKGNYNKAIKLYYDLASLLNKELDVEPENSTKQIFKDILELKDANNNSVGKSAYFYGRYNELYNINNSINNFICNSTKSFLISGEAGIGKTSLINKIEQSINHDKLYVLKSICYNAEENFYFKAWHNIFSDISQFIKQEKIDIPTSWQNVINYIFPNFITNSSSTDFETIEIVDNSTYQIAIKAILEVFSKLAMKKKILLIFEDIQWMDDMSRLLLSNILVNLAPENVMLIGTCRDDFEEKISSFTIPLVKHELLLEIKLNRFSYDETKEIVSQFLKDKTYKKSLIKNIFKDTEGNPLFLMELLKAINENGYTKELSSKVTNIIKSRIVNLNIKEKKVLNKISMFFDKINITKLKLLIDLEELEIFDIIENLQSKHLIEELIIESDIYYRFTHQKIREYVYNSQSEGKKKLLHTKISDYLEKNLNNNNNDKFLYPNLIYHFERCYNIKKAVHYKIKNLSEYYSFLHETFPIVIDSNLKIQSEDNVFKVEEELLEIENQLANVHDESFEFMRLKMELSYLFGRYYIHVGEYSSGLGKIDISMQLAELLNDKQYQLNNYKQMIYYSIQVHNMITMNKYINKSLDIAEKLDNIQEKGTLLRLKGLYFIKTKHYDKAEDLLNQSINIFNNLNKIQNRYSLAIAACYNYIGQIYKYSEDFDKSLNYFSKAISLCEKNHITKGLYIFYTNAGQILFEIEKYNESEYYINKSLELFGKYDDIWGRGMAEGYAALLAIKKNDSVKAHEHLKNSEKIAKKFNNPRALSLVNRIKKEIDKTH